MPEVRIVGRGGAGAATASDDEYGTAVVISRPTLPWHDVRCKFEGGESWGIARSEWEAVRHITRFYLTRTLPLTACPPFIAVAHSAEVEGVRRRVHKLFW